MRPWVVALMLVGVVATATAAVHAQNLRAERAPVVWIPGGWFTRGSDERDLRHALELCRRGRSGPSVAAACDPERFLEETPQASVWVSRFGIDRTEVTHGAFRRCVVANRCAPPRLSDADYRVSASNHPVAGVTYSDAARYCAFVGGRLPTEAEWERAARGSDGRRFPWGNHYNPRVTNHGGPSALPSAIDGYRYASPVGSYPSGRSPFGLLDMAGNVWEWTSDRYEPESYLTGERVDPHGAEIGGERIIRGGSWRFPPYALRVTHREYAPETQAWPDLGFRCAYSTR